MYSVRSNTGLGKKGSSAFFSNHKAPNNFCGFLIGGFIHLCLNFA